MFTDWSLFVEDNDVERVLLTVDDAFDVVFDVVVFIVTLVVVAFFVMEIDVVELVVVLDPNNLRGRLCVRAENNSLKANLYSLNRL